MYAVGVCILSALAIMSFISFYYRHEGKDAVLLLNGFFFLGVVVLVSTYFVS